MKYMGDYAVSTVLYGSFTTYRPSTGAAYALAGTPILSVYKNDSAAQWTTVISVANGTLSNPDSVAGFNVWKIDTSADGTFFATGNTFHVVITTGTVDGVDVAGSVVATFTLGLGQSTALRPTTAGRTLDVSATGEAGLDWANVGAPTTTLALTNTTVGVATNLTNAPTNGDLTATMKTSVTTAATAATPTAAAVTGAVGSVTGAVGSVAANGITATSIAADAINATAVKADAVTKIQTGLATPTNITAGTLTTVTNLTNLPAITANWLTAAGIAATALNGKGDWNVGKTGYALTQTFPANFADLTIAVTTGIVDANIQKINDVTITGNGQSGTEFGV